MSYAKKPDQNQPKHRSLRVGSKGQSSLESDLNFKRSVDSTTWESVRTQLGEEFLPISYEANNYNFQHTPSKVLVTITKRPHSVLAWLRKGKKGTTVSEPNLEALVARLKSLDYNMIIYEMKAWM